MSILLMRTVTPKSIFGFGKYTDISIQQMLNMGMHKELLKIYYSNRNLDYNQELKDALCIHGEHEIDKRNYNHESRYYESTNYHINQCLKQILSKKTDDELDKHKRMKRKEMHYGRKQVKAKESIYKRTIFSKGVQQMRNHNKYVKQ